MIVTTFYFMVFAMALMMFARIIIGNKRADTLLVMGTLLIVINSLGRYIWCVAETLETAIWGSKVVYVGAVYLPFVFVLLLAKLSEVNIDKIVVRVMAVCSTLVLGATMTIGRNDWYYKNVELVREDGYSYLIKEYGPLQKCFMALMVMYGCIMAWFIIYAIRNRQKISHVVIVNMGGMGAAVIGLYLLEKIFNMKISLVSIGYLVASALFIKYFERLKMYDMSENIISASKKKEKYGYIAFDKKYNYILSNELIRKVFPTVNEWIVDKPVPVSEDFIYTDVVKMMMSWEGKDEESRFITVDDKYYDVTIKYITNGRGKNVGYLLEFNDRTIEKKYYNTIEEFSACLEEEVEEKTREIQVEHEKREALLMQTVMALSETVDAKDRYTSGHSERVAKYAKMIAAKMGKSIREQDEIYRAGLLHDVGKIRIPEEIINKPGKLTEEEYNIIKIHPITGYYILRGISDDNEIALAAKYHHERYDGGGYPNGLAGEKIPEIARILGVADSYDAMASNRSYRRVLPQDIVRSEIERGKGKQFDPLIADIMLELIDEDKEYSMKENDGSVKRILTVDDEQMNNKVIAHIMKDEPFYEVVSATGGNEALELLSKEKFDLILLDVKMPEINGVETLKRIREKYDVPVVLMTSDKTFESSAEFTTLGCDDFITKPLLPLLLKEVIYNMSK